MPALFFELLAGTVLLGIQPADDLPAGTLARLGDRHFLNYGRVQSLAYSPDGKMLAAGGWDGTLLLVDAVSGKEIGRQATAQFVYGLAFSPDGKTLAASTSREITLWEVPTGKLVRKIHWPATWLRFVDGGKNLVIPVGGGVDLVDVAEKKIQQLRFRSLCKPAISPDGKTIACLVETKTIVVLNVRTGKQDRRLTSESDLSLWGELVFSSGGKRLFLIGQSATIHSWDVVKGKELPVMTTPGYSFFRHGSLAISPDDRTLAVSDSSGIIHLLEISSGLKRGQFQAVEPGEKIAFSPDGRTLASGSTDRSILLWDLTGRRLQKKSPPLFLKPEELNKLWNDLDSKDGELAYRAIWTLVAGSKHSVPFLRSHLCFPPPPDADTCARLVKALDDPQFSVRNQAFVRLKKFGPAVEAYLQEKLKEKMPLESRRRLEQVLSAIDDWWAKKCWPRALEVLEHIGTEEAQKVLADLTRTPYRRLAAEAHAVLQRIETRKALEPRP